MKANTKLGKIKETIIFGRLLRASIAATAVFVLAFVLTPYILAEANAVTDVDTKVSWNQVSLTLDPDYGNGSMTDEGHGDVEFGDIVPTSVADGNVGTMHVIKKNIGVTTNGQFYSVYLSMAGTTQSLILEDSTLEIEPIDATWNGTGNNAPHAFSGTSWGFAVPTGNGTTTLTTPFTYDYSSNYDAILATDLTKTSHSSAYNQGTWAQVPVVDTANNVGPQQIWKAVCSTTNSQGHACATYGIEQDSFPVYYGIMVDTDTMSGTYTNQIVYTAMASSASLDQVSMNINRSTKFVASGTVETLSVDLSTSGGSFTKDDVEVYLIPHNIAAANSYSSITTPNDFSTYKVDANKCTIGTGASDFVVSSTGLTLNCTLPDSPNGIDDGRATTKTTENTSGVQLGEFDIWLHVKNYNYDYISKYTKNTSPVASIVYAGLQSTYVSATNTTTDHETGDPVTTYTYTPYITKMQDMSDAFCKNTNKWGAVSNNTYARVYNYTGTGTALADTTAGSAALGIGSFSLLDSRDSHPYLIRRLADGNCWMVENLDLELANFAGKKTAESGALTPDNTDLRSTEAKARGYWDPTEATNYKITNTYATALADAGLTSDFTGLTTYVLGAAQATQYQQKGTYGANWHWGSRKNVAGDIIVSTDSTNAAAANADSGYNSWHQGSGVWIENNQWSEIPRSYNNDYDYLAGTALDGTSYTGGVGSTWSADQASTYYGHYYNWYAATAESGKFSTPGGTTVDDSICPKGWSLPVNGDSSVNKSWQKLLFGSSKWTSDGDTLTTLASNGDSSSAMRQVPLSLAFTGGYHLVAGSLRDRGSSGAYWSSTAASTSRARLLYFNSTGVYPQVSSGKPDGFTVRCVAR